MPVLTLAYVMIRDNNFLGNETSLIYAKQVMLNFTNNVAIGNGFLSNNMTKKTRVAD